MFSHYFATQNATHEVIQAKDPYGSRVEIFHALNVCIRILCGKVCVDTVDYCGIRPPALAHCSHLRPTEMVGKGREAVTKTVNADFWQITFLTQFVNTAEVCSRVCGNQFAFLSVNYIIQARNDYVDIAC